MKFFGPGFLLLLSNNFSWSQQPCLETLSILFTCQCSTGVKDTGKAMRRLSVRRFYDDTFSLSDEWSIAWTWTVDMDMQYRHGYAIRTRTWSTDLGMQHGHGRSLWAWTCNIDMDMQHGRKLVITSRRNYVRNFGSQLNLSAHGWYWYYCGRHADNFFRCRDIFCQRWIQYTLGLVW